MKKTNSIKKIRKYKDKWMVLKNDTVRVDED